MTLKVPFNKPFMTGRELWFISQAHANGHLSGDGAFTKRCHRWLEQNTGCDKALLTHSCTAALEMAEQDAIAPKHFIAFLREIGGIEGAHRRRARLRRKHARN